MLIPLGGTPCIVCLQPGGVLAPGECVMHYGWNCRLPNGPVTAAGSAPAEVVGDSPAGWQRYYQAQLRAARHARRRLVNDRLVAVDVPREQHGLMTYMEHGCHCVVCLPAGASHEGSRA